MIKRKSIFKLKQREFASNSIAAMPKASKPSFPTKVNFNNSVAGIGKNINSNTSLSSLLSSRSSANYVKPSGNNTSSVFSGNNNKPTQPSSRQSMPTGGSGFNTKSNTLSLKDGAPPLDSNLKLNSNNYRASASSVGKNINSNTSLSSLLSSRSSANYTKPTGGTNNNSLSPNSSTGGSVLSGASSKPTGSNPSSGGNSKPNPTGGSIFSSSKETPKAVTDKDFFDKHVGNSQPQPKPAEAQQPQPQPQQPQGKGKGGGGKGKGQQPTPADGQTQPAEGQQPQPTTQSTQPVEGQADANTNQADSGQQEGSWLGNKWKNSGILGKTGMVGAGALGAYTAYQGLSSLMGGGRRKKRDDE